MNDEKIKTINMKENKHSKAPIYSIFNSISGETGAIPQGCPTTFIRMGACNMKCPYCDALPALNVANCEWLSVLEVQKELEKISVSESSLLITGGEPLLHQSFIATLIKRIERRYISIQIETNGTIDPTPMYYELLAGLLRPAMQKVNLVVDVKSKSSGIDSCYNEIHNHQERWFAFSSHFNTTYKYVVANEQELIESIFSIIKLDETISKMNEEKKNRTTMSFYAIGPIMGPYPDLNAFYNHFKSYYDKIAKERWEKQQQYTPILLNFQLHKLIGRHSSLEEKPIKEVIHSREEKTKKQ